MTVGQDLASARFGCIATSNAISNGTPVTGWDAMAFDGTVNAET
jgi:hypothetical protein